MHAYQVTDILLFQPTCVTSLSSLIPVTFLGLPLPLLTAWMVRHKNLTPCGKQSWRGCMMAPRSRKAQKCRATNSHFLQYTNQGNTKERPYTELYSTKVNSSRGIQSCMNNMAAAATDAMSKLECKKYPAITAESLVLNKHSERQARRRDFTNQWNQARS